MLLVCADDSDAFRGRKCHGSLTETTRKSSNIRTSNITLSQHPKIMRFVCEPLPLDDVKKHLERIVAQLHEAEPNQLKLLLKQAVPEYQPYLS